MAPMKPDDVIDLVKLYKPLWLANRERLDWVDRWYRGSLDDADKPSMPQKPTKEYRELRDRSITPWLKFVVRSLAQGMHVEGFRPSDGDLDDNVFWRMWQRNGLDSRQTAVYRGMMAHALAYVTVLPGDANGDRIPVMRGVSARKMLAFYQDVANDEWPTYALAGETIHDSGGRPAWRWRLYDDEAIYTLDSPAMQDAKLDFITNDEHNAGECPVVRFANEMDLDGRSDGEVEPFIDLAARINQDTFDRLVVQRFGAWVVRYMTGLAKPETDEEERAVAKLLEVGDFLVAEDTEAKIGSLPATPLDGFISARDSDLRDLAVVTQTPPADMLGQMINLSAEALAAAQDGRSRKLDDRKHTAGESWEQAGRLGAHLMGDRAAAADFGAQVVWKDHESRSLAQMADAFGKLVTMLGFPAEVLWSKIPGVTQTDLEEARKIVEKAGGMDALVRKLMASVDEPEPSPAA